MLDWLIVGGGIHGTHLALALLGRGKVAPERLRILDPHPQLLARWEACTANTGMRFLRSTRVHHLGAEPHDLEHFAKRHSWPERGSWLGPYGRPSLALFQAHTRHLIAQRQLDTLHIAERATTLKRLAHGWQVTTAAGEIATRRVLLAIGVGEQPRWPDWAVALHDAGAPIDHLFAPTFQREALPPWRRAVVVGGGITAAQTALALARQSPGSVTLLLRHAIREAGFDSDPCWVGPLCLDAYGKLDDVGQRRVAIGGARNAGSMPRDVARTLRRADRAGLLTICEGEVAHAHVGSDAQITLHLVNDPASRVADRIILATGFEQQRPGGQWLDTAIAEHGLPCAPCGYPIVHRALRWADGLYVTGALAELELGPAARNIVGARHAAQRLL